MKFFFNTPAYKPAFRAGGPIHSVASLAEKLVSRGHTVRIATSNLDLGEPMDIETNRDHDIEGVSVRYFNAQPTLLQQSGIPYFSRAGVFKFGPEFSAWLRHIGSDTDVFHSQISFQTTNRIVSRFAKDTNRIYLYHQRGNLDPLRLRKGRLKKELYIRTQERRVMQRADSLLALTNYEVQSYHRILPDARVDILPNGIDLDFCESALSNISGPVVDALSQARGEPIFTFMSRLHSLKGPDIFVKAAIIAMKRGAKFHAIVAGPDQLGVLNELKSLVDSSDCGSRFHFLGPVTGEDRLALLKSTDCFVLPTLSEGFSMVLLEALLSRCSVITTPGAYFDEIQKANAGLIAERSIDAITAAILKLVSLGKDSLFCMGQRGRQLVIENYSWDGIVDRYIQIVEELIDRRSFRS